MIKFIKNLYLLIFLSSCEDIGKNYLWNNNLVDIFNRKFGTEGYDYGWSLDISEFDNGIILTGSQQPIIGSQKDLWAIKTDNIGFSKWDKKFGGSRDEEGRDVISTSDGGFLFIGYTWSFGNEQQVYAIKTDHHGNLEWEKSYGGTMWEVGSSVVELNEGGYAITGFSNSPGISSGNTDVLLLKINSNGDIIWLKAYGNNEYPNHERGNDLVELNDGSMMIVGSRDRYTSGSKNIIILRIDKFGNKIWEKELLGNDLSSEIGYSITETLDGSFYICSSVNSEHSLEVYKPNITKIDRNGNIDWNRTFDSRGKHYHQYRAIVSEENEIYIVGSSINEDSYKNKSNAFVLKIDENGQILSSLPIGTEDEDDWGWSIDINRNGNIVIVGSTKSNNASLFDIMLVGIKSKEFHN